MTIEEESKLIDTRLRIKFLSGARMEMSIRVNFEREPEQATALYALYLKYFGRRPVLGAHQAVTFRTSDEEIMLLILKTYLPRLGVRRRLAEMAIEYLESTNVMRMAQLVIDISAEDHEQAKGSRIVDPMVRVSGRYEWD